MDIEPRNDIATRLAAMVVLIYWNAFLWSLDFSWFIAATGVISMMTLIVLVSDIFGHFLDGDLPFRAKPDA